MSNTLTAVSTAAYAGLNVVSRELVGYISGATINGGPERAAKDENVAVIDSAAGALEDITPGNVPADSGDTTPTVINIVMDNAKVSPIRWEGEEQALMNMTGQLQKTLADQMADAMRKVTNQIETDLGVACKIGASRAYGTAGTTPFGTANNLTDVANMKKILDDNGAPGDRQLVLGTAAMVNLGGIQSSLFKVNEAGTDAFLRDGLLGRLHGFAIRDSAGVGAHTKGTGTLYDLNDASSAIGDTALVIDTGSGTILAGDIISFAGDTANDYVVGIDGTTTLATINKPGLRVALADDDDMTIGNAYTANSAFSRSAVVLAIRAPALPNGGDDGEHVMISDPVSGLTFDVGVYRQYHRVKIEVGAVWGVKVVKPAHVATLVG